MEYVSNFFREEKMKYIDVFQCELNKTIPLEYIGKVKYIGETFGIEGLTNMKEYNIVRDRDRNVKVVDDSDEDYIYSLINPRPLDGSSVGGTFYIIDDPNEELKGYGLEKYETYK